MRRCLFAIVILCFGCEDKGLYSGHPLVGTWNYNDSDFTVTASRNLRAYLTAQGVDDGNANQIVSDFGVGEGLGLGLSQLIFTEDGHFTDNAGGSGTWSVGGDKITLRESSGFGLEAGFRVEDEALTLTMSKAQLLAFMTQGGEAWSQDERTFFDIIIHETDRIAFNYARQ